MLYLERGIAIKYPQPSPNSTDAGAQISPSSREASRGRIRKPVVVSPDRPAAEMIAAGQHAELRRQIAAIKAAYPEV